MVSDEARELSWPVEGTWDRMDKDCLTVKDFARRKAMSVPTVRRLIKAGVLPHYQVGGRKHLILIPRDALERAAVHATSAEAPRDEIQASPAGIPPRSQPRWMRWRPGGSGSGSARMLTDG